MQINPENIGGNDDVHVKKCVVGIMQENCYVVYSAGRNDCVVIDPGDEADKIAKAVGEKEIAAILLTHGHFDHMGAVDALSQGKIKVYLHPDDHCCLEDEYMNACRMTGQHIRCRSVTENVSDGSELDIAGMKIHVIHTPGHTMGSVCYLIGSLLFAGDTVFPDGGYGRTDLPGGSEEKMNESLYKLSALLPEVRLFGGHG